MSKLFFAVFLLSVSAAYAQEEEFPRLRFSGLLDARFISTDTAESWLNAGTGKLRYGGDDEDRAELVRLSQASLLVSAALSDVLSARMQLNVDAEPDRFNYRSPVDLIEGFVSYRPVLSPRLRLRMRAGIFFPPVSLENTGTAWTTPYSITTSAINTWIGEEVRVSGGEFSVVFAPEHHEVAIGGSVFGNNDPAGSLLAWRGWALHDRQTGLSEQLPLADIPAIQPDGLFPRQAPYVQPFREIDGKLGYYANASWNHRLFELRAFYYNNRGEPTEFDGYQYAWKTTFYNTGAAFHLPAEVEVLAQYMNGTSIMGFGESVYIDFKSAFALITKSIGSHRFTLRYDTFEVEDEDSFPVIDNNNEEGSAWTFAYLLQTGEHHRIALELLRVDSDRDVRLSLYQPRNIDEFILQASFRLAF